MQSGGGQFGVPGIQQFMVEGCSPHGLFAALSTASPHDNSNAHHHLQQQQQQHINQQHHHHIQQQQQQQQQSFPNQRIQQQLGLQAAVAAAAVSEAPGGARPRDHTGLGDKPNKVFGFREAAAGSSNVHGVADHVATHVLQQQQQHQPLTDDDGDGERGGGGLNRWPMEETLALLRIRSQMDSNFRDSNLKGPLWENVSRKLAELGYHRSAKKCKEKFENVNKYHKKTKDGRMGRQDGKSYRYFNELEALSNTLRHHLGTQPTLGDRGFTEPQDGDRLHQSMIMAAAAAETSNAALNISSDTHNTSEDDEYENNNNNNNNLVKSPPPSRIRKRKRKHRFQSMAVFFESLVKQLMEHQEELHRKFLEAIERREQERLNREEAWRRQEMARLTRETEIRAQEQALASTREAALVAFLQKFTGEDLKLPAATEDQIQDAAVQEEQQDKDAMSDPCNSKRWPKPEVQALIRLRSSIEARFQEPGVKGPLWEEISSGMACLGFHRSAKRCKEKWENINKYFRKTKDSIKKRPENAKTCPYFHQLDALYGKGLLTSSAAGTSKAKVHGHSSDTLLVDQGGGEDHDTNDNNNNSNNNGNNGEDDDEVQAQIRSDSELLVMIPADNQPAMKNNAEHFFQEDHAAHQSPKRLKINSNQTPNSLGMSFDLSGSSKLQPSSDGHKKAVKMETIVKEMFEMQQQKFLDDFERREQEQDRQQSINNHDQVRQRGETQDERSQSALMALVHKLTVNAADYAAQ